MSQTDYSHSKIWRIAAPLIVSNITVPMLGIVDTAVVGHLDSPVYLGAVATGATIFGFLFLGLNFLRMGTTGVTAQALGQSNDAAIAGTLIQALAIALALAAGLIVLQWPLGELALHLLAPDDTIRDTARSYFRIRIYAAPAVLANFVMIGWFIGQQNGRAPLAMMVCVNGINIVLDVLFVVYLGYTSDGVAIASVIAEFCGLALGLLLAGRLLRARPAVDLRKALFDRERMRALLAVNGNLWIRTLALAFAFGLVTAQGARLGGVILAANAVLMNFQLLMAYALDALANAAEALVGRAIGRDDSAGLHTAFRRTLAWSLAFAVLIAVIYLVAGKYLILAMTGIDDVRAVALTYLPWLIVSPLISVWSFFYDGVFVGATRAREMRNTMLISSFLIFTPAVFALSFLGNHGLWLALMLFLASRGITMHVLWRRGFIQPR